MKTKILKGILLLGIALTLLSFDMPKGWSPGGTDLTQYEMGLDKGAGQNGSNAATIKNLADKPKAFGTMLQSFAPDKFLGKRIKMTGYMKSQDVISWAGFWLRVDQANSKESLSFDNMGDRPVKGTSDWKIYEIVLDVPENASNIYFGALLEGKGQIWFDNLKFEIVDKSVPTTGKGSGKNAEPTNLDFEK
ncbi:MAG: hypothetical protein ACXVPU_00580 [Bacteroidia bacterium]